MTVDIIIPTYKPDIKFRQLMHRLQLQTYPINKIIIVNTETGDFSVDTGEQSVPVEVYNIKKEEFDHGGTRHFAALKSDSEILLFMTQDAVPQNDKLVGSLVGAFENDRVAAAYGRQLAYSDSSLIEKYTRNFNYPAVSSVKSEDDIGKLGIKTFFCSNVCAAYRRQTYDLLGGFIRNTIFNEDMILGGAIIHAGWKIAYVSEARVYHSHNYTAMQQLKRNFDMAVSQRDNPQVFKGIKSESEGIRLIKKTAAFLLRQGKPWLIIDLLWKSSFKYLGYQMGMHYQRLPHKLIRSCSMNPEYWKEGGTS